MRQRNVQNAAKSDVAIAVVGYAALALSLLPAVVALVNAMANHQWARGLTWGLLIAVVAIALIRLVLRRQPVAPPDTVQFHPFRVVDTSSAWSRPREVELILDALRADPGGPIPVVVGSSGVGKTVLLKVLVPSSASTFDYHYIDAYEDARRRLDRLIAGRTGNSSEPSIVVLDQFEQWLGRAREMSPAMRHREQAWLLEFVSIKAPEANLRVLISLRKEWFYDLRFLAHLVPAPIECCNVTGPATGEDDPTSLEIEQRLETVLPRPEDARGIIYRLGVIGVLLPLETQIVGTVLERKAVRGQGVSVETFDSEMRGVSGAIDLFFEEVLDGAPDRRVALKVLCALSARTRFRQQELLDDLLQSLFEPEDDTRMAVDYLLGQNLLVRRGIAQFELAHDYLAEYFSSLSGAELNPIDRDNILYHVEATTAVEHGKGKVRRNTTKRNWFGRVALIPLFVLMAVRLLDFGLDWNIVGSLQPALVDGKLLDANYAAFILPHAAWITYIAIFYDRVFSRLKEGRLATAFSIITVLNLYLCVALGVFAAYAWVIAIGLGGMLLALKMMSLSYRSDLNRAAKERFNNYGTTTLFATGFLTAIGVAFYLGSAHIVQNGQHAAAWLFTTLALATLLTYACFTMWKIHVSPSGAAQLLGLAARGRQNIVSRPDTGL